MDLTAFFNINLPLTNPVLIFSLILFIILFSPIILNRLSIPSLIGLIIAGVIIGPFGFNLIARDSSIELFGTVGLLYIMFISSLEMDITEFKKNSGKSMIFGIYTFMLPMLMGTFAGVYLLDFSWITSILLASMFASNTLITYPIVSKYGIVKNRAVNISIGGTIITTIAALFVLAVIVGMSNGEIDNSFWIKLIGSLILFSSIILFVFPLIGRWFFKNHDDNISQYIFVLGLVFMGAFLVQVGGIEPIVGAFLVGIALNKLIPRTSPLMNRIEFVGNALFIPFFLIGVGMMIDMKAFFVSTETIIVAAVMTIIANFSKYIAAWLAQKSFGYSVDERRIIFGLTNAQAASTLAAVLVGYNVIIGYTLNGEPIRLLNDSVLNGTILMILITCTVASFVTQRGAVNLAASESAMEDPLDEEVSECILIPLSNMENVEELVNLSVTVKSPQKGSQLVGLNILNSTDNPVIAEKNAEKLMEKASKIAAATDNKLVPVVRYDTNVVNGIASVVKEHKITDIIIGLHEKKGISDTFLGNLAQGILQKCNTTTMIYRPVQTFGTISRNLIFVPDHADKEQGFPFWLVKMWNIGKNTGAKLVFYGSKEILKLLKEVHKKHPVEAEFKEFSDWDDFLILGRDVKNNDNLVFVLSRKNYPSYHTLMAKASTYLNKYFINNNFILIYPQQAGVDSEEGYNPTMPSMYEPLADNLERLEGLVGTIGKLISRK